jgi:outer membrane lipoprotein-sorting protein
MSQLKGAFRLSLSALLVLCALSVDHSCNSAGLSRLAMAQPDGKQFIEGVADKVSALNDYICQTEVHSFATGKDVKSSCKFYYKNGGEVRIEVTGGGFRDGTVIVRTKNGIVRAHGGGLMGGLKMNLDPDSRMLIMANGVNVTRSGFPEVFGELRKTISSGYSATISKQQAASGDPESYMVQILDDKGVLVNRIFVDAQTKMPLQLECFRDGKPLTIARFTGLRTNVGLPEETFQM